MTPYRLSVLFVVCLALAAPTLAQDLHPSRRPSPTGLARTHIGDTYVSISYSRPYERGREVIFGNEEDGALVPYGKVWRTGANEASQITATGDITVGGKTLPAGTYSLFSTPGPESWTLHFNSKLGLNGLFARNPETGEFENAYFAENNVIDVEVVPTTLPEEDKVDQFTISFETEGDVTGLVMRWITTELRVPVGTG